MPSAEIAFIHDYESDVAKARLFKAVREGRIRVLLGSTGKMGVGTNVQTRLVALHHLNAPWRPADIELREGRIERQGNLDAEVTLYRYVAEGSFDTYLWQTLETKAKFIAQVMHGDTGEPPFSLLPSSTRSWTSAQERGCRRPYQRAAVDPRP